jgi:hypothetical protein
MYLPHESTECLCACHVPELRREITRLQGVNDGLRALMFDIMQTAIDRLLQIKRESTPNAEAVHE